jgi:ABC-type transport system involved in cytochrome bd biosynthesis fused ATPase/permease subunit
MAFLPGVFSAVVITGAVMAMFMFSSCSALVVMTGPVIAIFMLASFWSGCTFSNPHESER